VRVQLFAEVDRLEQINIIFIMAFIGQVRKRVMAPFVSRKRRRFAPKGRTATFNRQTRRNVRGPMSRGSLRDRVSSIARVVKSIVPEIKYTSESLASSNIQAAGDVIPLTAVAAGTGSNERVGDVITVKSIQCYGIISRTADATASDIYFRFCVFVDKEQIADTEPTIATVFESAGEPWVPVPSLATQGRFRMLAMSKLYSTVQFVPDLDSVYGGNPGTLVPTQMPYVEIKWSGDIKVTYNGTADTDIQKNGIYFGIMCSQNSTIDFTGAALVSYIDS